MASLRRFVFSFLLFAIPAAAQEMPLDTIVVTASRIPQDSRTIGSSVSVITGDEIARFQERLVLDALTTVPGVDAARAGPPGGQASIFLRGADSYQTLVLIDGVPVADPSGTQTAFDFGRLLATDIERIEVLRGPQSTLYGGDAVGGVIDITTKGATDGFGASALAEGGSFGAVLLSGRLAYGAPEGSAHLDLARYATDGFPSVDPRFGGHLDQGMQTFQANGGGTLKPTDWLSLRADFRTADTEAGYPGNDFTTGLPIDAANEARTHERSGRVAATASLLDGALEDTLDFMDSVIHRHTLDTQFGEADYAGERRKIEDLLTVKPLDQLSAVAGLSWLQDRAETSFDERRTTITRALFAELQGQPLPDLYLTAGGRLDDHSTFGAFRTYRVTAAYRIEMTGTKLRAADGTGFRAPSLFELYDPFSGNASLRPETSRGWEVGLDQDLGKLALLKLTYFNQRIDNRIDFDFATFGYFNEGHTRARGVEAELDANPLPDLSLRASYTYNQTENLDDGTELLRRSRHSGSLLADWQAIPGLDLTATLRLVGSRADTGGHRLSGYGRLDLGARYALTDQVTVEGRIENLNDARYEEVYAYGVAGRAVYGGLSVSY